MDEPFIPQVDTHMRDEIRTVVRLGEENQISPFQRLVVRNDTAKPGLLLRPAGKFYSMSRKRNVGQS